jgi:hypothetical protein
MKLDFRRRSDPKKIRFSKGKEIRKIIKIANAKRKQNVEDVGSHSATYMYIPPMVTFKGVKLLESHKQDLPTGSTVQTTESGCIDEADFLEWLQRFRNAAILASACSYWMVTHLITGTRTTECLLL